VEGALVGGALTEERHGHVVLAQLLEGQGMADGRWHPFGDDPAAAEVGRRVEEVHVAALAVAQAGLLAEDLGGEPLHVHAVGQGDVVRPVGGGDRIGRSKVSGDPHRDRFLSGRQVHLAGHGPSGDVEGRGLALEVDLLEGLLEEADPYQLVVHVDQCFIARHHVPSVVRSERCSRSSSAPTSSQAGRPTACQAGRP
jgi:hypothetical protein